MPITTEPTPNPNALKFTVGKPVGGPTTFVAGTETHDPLASALLALDGVTSVFLTADFVTLSKASDADWETIAPSARQILDGHFGA
ncbi:MAG: NifU N-terminal domain-containing protein [Acidimicrobiia bacterium]